MTRFSAAEAARIKGGDCAGLRTVMLIGAITGAWEISLAAYIVSDLEGCK